MSVSSTVNRIDYLGNGATSVYSYPFKIIDEDHLLITIRNTDDEEETQVITTDYTVSGVGNAAGGNVTLVAGNLASGYILTIRRVVPVKQLVDIRNQGSFFPETHEDAFDYLTYIDQQQQDLLDRSFTLPETVSAADVNTQLPIPVAGRAVGWNDAGDGLANLASAGELEVSAFVENLLDDATAAEARTTLDAAQKLASLTAEATIALDDYVPIVDTSESSAENKMLVSDLVKVTNLLTADATPDPAADFILTYDTSATAAKKVTPNALVSAAISTITTAQLADQTEIEAASSTTKFVSPGRQHFHPAACKAWCKIVVTAGAPSSPPTVGYNVTSVTDVGVGVYTVNFTVPFSSAHYTYVCGQEHDSGTALYLVAVDGDNPPTTSAFRVNVLVPSTGAPADPRQLALAFFGDQ